MSQYDDRHEALKAQLSETQKGLAALPDERRQDIQDELARLEGALGSERSSSLRLTQNSSRTESTRSSPGR